MLVQGGKRIPLLRYHRSSAVGERGKQVGRCPRVHHQSSDACRTELPAKKSAYDALARGGSWALWQPNGLLCWG